ncbi:MAG: primosomal protein N' [Sphingobacteriaceae bacterium]|nr:primosomal protein N' [Sphingobacteriaceae bacterium]
MPAESTERQTFFVNVVLPLAISKAYTYRVPQNLVNNIAIGKRVVVQFGRNRVYTAIIFSISDKAPVGYEAKYILDVLDEFPIVTAQQLALWEWMSAYYLCTLGEVMQAALPSALKLASETKVTLNIDADYDKSTLTDKEFLLLDALEIQPVLTIAEIVKILDQKTVFPILRALFDKGMITISEELTEKYRAKTKTYVQLNSFYADAANRRALFDLLERAPKQVDVLQAYLQLAKTQNEIAKSDLLEASDASAATLQALVAKEVFILVEQEVSRLSGVEADLDAEFTLSTPQQEALNQLKTNLQEKEVCLVHGVTASGKTEIYIRLIEEYLAKGKQVLYLLPEIGLTTQVIQRLQKIFGTKIGVYHSKFNDNERAEIWQKVLNGDYQVVLGARSAVFLPFNNLGLVVVDEEHENSFKQFDPAPRYHARDSAIFLASLFKAKVVLGSATPSFESYYNAKIGKYGLITLSERYGGVQLPDIQVVSIPDETKRKTMQSHFTSVLLSEIKGALARKEQIILFQNRRGYAPVLLCATCGYTPKCINCEVSLTYHKSSGKLHCHYCGYRQDTVPLCPACGSTKIEHKGFGTEKVEDELSLIFPEARIARMDVDATRTKYGFQQLISDFEDKKIDILVGTQMVAKGLDFANVSTIGILNADSMLNFPDFRAFERSFQLLAQVSGRAGRRDIRGKVIVQAHDIHNRVLQQVIDNDYEGLFQTELIERRNYKYPPLYRLISLCIKHKDPVKLNQIAEYVAALLRQQFGDRVLGPEAPFVNRIRNYYLQDILLKVEKEGLSAQKVKIALQQILQGFEQEVLSKGCIIQVDVDPY